jgi:hypothetical protein
VAAPHTLSRAGLEAHRESLLLPFPEIVSKLVELIGRKLTAYVAGVKDVRAIDRWIKGNGQYRDVESRLRFTFQVVRTLSEHDSAKVIQGWLTGVNPELGDRVPIRLLREGDPNTIGPEILGAARAYIAGG